MSPRPRPVLGIRGRLTLLSVVLVAVALTVGAGVFANLLNRVLVAQLQASVESEAAVVAGVVAEEGPGAIRSDAFTTLFRVQVLDAVGNVIYTSTAEPTPLSTQRPRPGEVVTEGAQGWWFPWNAPPADIVAATGSRYNGVDHTVLVATSQRHPHDTVSTTAGVMLAFSPLLLLLAAGLTWWLVGRTLSPVEAIRRRVETLTATNLSERVPTPGTGDEIAALADTMNSMLARLSAARDAQLRFVSDVSHELRSPLTAITGALELVDGEPTAHTGQLAELLPLVNDETARMRALVESLLYLSRTDAQPARRASVDVDLDDLATAEVARLRAVTSLRVTGEIAVARVTGDPDALARVLRNLCDNASRHAATAVRVATASDGATVTLTVEDDGAGVPEADRQRIFGRFVRLDDSRSRDAGGSGLGLAIVAQIVAGHGGAVLVDTSPHLGGARFVVTLPVQPAGQPLKR